MMPKTWALIDHGTRIIRIVHRTTTAREMAILEIVAITTVAEDEVLVENLAIETSKAAALTLLTKANSLNVEDSSIFVTRAMASCVAKGIFPRSRTSTSP
jgi:hypothetical protein